MLRRPVVQARSRPCPNNLAHVGRQSEETPLSDRPGGVARCGWVRSGPARRPALYRKLGEILHAPDSRLGVSGCRDAGCEILPG
jgi:hypothetical protein